MHYIYIYIYTSYQFKRSSNKDNYIAYLPASVPSSRRIPCNNKSLYKHNIHITRPRFSPMPSYRTDRVNNESLFTLLVYVKLLLFFNCNNCHVINAFIQVCKFLLNCGNLRICDQFQFTVNSSCDLMSFTIALVHGPP